MMKNTALIFLLSLLFLACSNNQKKELFVETAIIGGGLMGSATAWHLSNSGNEIILLEKQDSIYTQGSSYGEARIARSSNRGDDIWSFLHNNSVRETQELINFLNTASPNEPFKMDDIYTTAPVTYVGRLRIYDKLLASLIRQGVTYEMAANPSEGKSMFDVVLPDSVLLQREYNRYSGTVNPKKLIEYLHRAVRKEGNTVKYGTEVISVDFNKEKDVYELTIKDKKTGNTNLLLAHKVVTAAGPYTGSLLKNVAPYFDTLINPQRVFLAYFKINKKKYENLTEEQKQKIELFYPVINSAKGTRDGSFFSMIEYYDESLHPVIKVGGHFQRSTIDNLDEVWKKELSPKEIAWSLNSTASYFKLLNLPIEKTDFELVDGYSCVYSLTKNEVPFVTPILNADQSPNDRFIVLGGMSGVGAKGAMTYGLIAANLLNQKTIADSMYNVVKERLGVERLKLDVGY